ncbi:MAG TPA: DUF1453 domain-containing protein [Verrucomicrobiae bacterium]|nr:DUF1453 domain-containing protein [Verrucomicrobiae bacterium]
MQSGSFRPVNPVLIYILFGGLFAWSIYRRVRRNIGRQQLRPGRIIFRLAIFCVAAFFVLIAGLINPRLLWGFGAGVLGGVILGFAGLKLTKFETTNEGHFYTPDARIGVAVSLLLVGRLIYRFAVLNTASLASHHPPPMNSPLTFFIFGLTFGYYLVYYTGLFVHTHDKTRSIAPPVLTVPSPSGGEANSPEPYEGGPSAV